ncbi:hypothetical protein C8R44DRAFT_749229 [Mycena epipterygia]|nr:hypothetical protein C8R44DRAFT_749229 [Mycena epipterygia]
MPAKVMILAQFGHRYYIHGTLKRLTDVVAWPKAWWICILYPWDFEVADGRFGLAQGSVDPSEYETSHRPEIHATLASPERKCAQRLGGSVEEMPTKVMILAQFDHGYYIHGNLKRLTDVVAWLKAWWIRILYPWDFEVADGCFGLAQGLVDLSEMPAKVVILAQFGHGYYIRGTLKRLTNVVAWLQAWWICVFWLGSELHGLTVFIIWCRSLEFYTILASKSPALR